MICTRTCSAVAVGILALTMTATRAIAAPPTTCSNASVKGLYGLFITGYDSSGFYQMGVGQFNSNGAGKLTGVETVSDDGTIYNNLAQTGTYSIAADCTGSGTITNVKNGTQSHYNFVVDRRASRLRPSARIQDTGLDRATPWRWVRPRAPLRALRAHTGFMEAATC